MPPKHRQFAAFLATHRRAAKLSMAQLAEAVGVTKSNVHYWESGKGVAKPDVLESLAAALGVSYEGVLAAAGYRAPEGLPEPALYLRAKYRDLPNQAIAEAEVFFADLEARYERRPKGGRGGKRPR
jgi:transcriptional regulator with XRE-family HTH domain